MTYSFATTQHDHATRLRKVHIAREDEAGSHTLCGYKDGMLDFGGESQSAERVRWHIEYDVDNFLCARCVKAFPKELR